MTPAEHVSSSIAIVGSPVLAVMIAGSEEAWPVKAIAVSALLGLLWSTIRRAKEDAQKR